MTRSKEAMKRRSARKNARRRSMGRNGDANAAIRKYYAGRYALFTPLHLDDEESLFIISDVQPDYVAVVQEMFYGNLELSLYFEDGAVSVVTAWHDQVYFPMEETIHVF